MLYHGPIPGMPYKTICRQINKMKGNVSMKLILPLLTVLVMLFSAACGGNAAPVAEPVAEPVAAVQPAAAAVDLSTLAELIDPQTVAALRDNPEVLVIDVREQDEYNDSHIPGITLIPMSTIADRLAEIPKDKTVIVTCRSGNRSSQVASFLREQGFTNIHDMAGGIVAWQNAGLPVE